MAKTMTMDSLFHEEQKVRRPWLVALVVLAVTPAPVVLTIAVLSQLIAGHPWGDRPVSNGALLGITLASIVLSAAVLALVLEAKLVTVVGDDGLRVRFWPFHWSYKRIDLEQVVDVEEVTYQPLRQYGGWGIRWGAGGKAYTVAGNKGVKLTVSGGKKLLIGSQRPDELVAAIGMLWKKK